MKMGIGSEGNDITQIDKHVWLLCSMATTCVELLLSCHATIVLQGEVLKDSKRSEPRPGRRVAAERRRIARSVIREFYATHQFAHLPSAVQVALKEICPVRDSHPTRDGE